MALGDSYATLAELKARVTPSLSSTANDDALTNALSVASRSVDAYCHRQFNKADSASARVFSPKVHHSAIVDDFYTTDDLVIETDPNLDQSYSSLWTSTDYRLLPINGMRHGESWPFWQIKTRVFGVRCFPAWEDSLRVTAVWGWASVPAAVKEATLILAEETFKLKDAPFGVAGFGDFGMLRVRDNPKVASMLVPYRKKSVLVA